MINSNYLFRFGDALAVIPHLECPLILAGVLNNRWAEHKASREICIVQTITSRSFTFALKNSVVSMLFLQLCEQQKICLTEILVFTLVLQCRNSQSRKGESLDTECLCDKGWQWWLGESSDLSSCLPSVNWTLPYHRGRLNHNISLDSGFAPLVLWLTKDYSLIFSAFQEYSSVCKVCAITHTDSSALLISQVSVTKATCKINCFITFQNLLGRQCWSEECCRVLNGFIVHEVLSYHAANTDRGCLSDRAWWVKKEPFYVTFPRHSSACHSGIHTRNTEIHQRSEQTCQSTREDFMNLSGFLCLITILKIVTLL